MAETNGGEIGGLRGRWIRSYRSPNTRKTYAHESARFIAWCSSHDISVPHGVQRHHINDYARGMEKEQRKPNAINLAISAVSSFYSFLMRNDLVDRNPCATVDRYEVGPSESVALDVKESRALLATARRDSPRAGALVATLLYGGARVGELLAADVRNLTASGGRQVLFITNKGSERRWVPLVPDADDAIMAYLATRDGGAPGEPLFATKTGRRLDEPYVWRMVRRLAKDAGIACADKINPKSLRCTFVTLSLDAGVPLHDVQKACGHSDPRTTMRYYRGGQDPDRHPAHRLMEILAEPPDDQATA